ncbi:hypothetical protein KY49_734 [Burkholderia sp. MSHR3999]|uniref:hypothetical protein n=1 Tax=Burkholderia sp. MSHR3999 TaxID=1542965 RepID=UPI0005AC3D8E|nr:hypothetical protein [Burkholderia sp. MSHR3999]KIP14756.1 hypothetical protein KY49_734 [Burkholderia sp. MSHR3999]
MTTSEENAAEIAENKTRIEVHEAVCAERYKGILDSFGRGEKRMEGIEKKSQRIEWILYFLAAAVLVGPANALKLLEAFFK